MQVRCVIDVWFYRMHSVGCVLQATVEQLRMAQMIDSGKDSANIDTVKQVGCCRDGKWSF